MESVMREAINDLGEDIKLIESVTEEERVYIITQDNKVVARCYDWWCAYSTFLNVLDHKGGY